MHGVNHGVPEFPPASFDDRSGAVIIIATRNQHSGHPHPLRDAQTLSQQGRGDAASSKLGAHSVSNMTTGGQ